MIAARLNRRQAMAALCAAFGAGGGQAAPARGPSRTALVIGNANYEQLPLRNAIHDADAMGQMLAQCDFDVRVRQDLDWDGCVTALGDFTQRAAACDVRLFYYAGHGMQIDGRSYLNPIGAMPRNEHELRSAAIELEPLITQLSHLSEGVSIVIVDACRSNPYIGVARHRRGFPARAGVAAMAAPRGVVVAFATGPEGNAQDGSPTQDHGTFTRFLLQEMKAPGMTIEQALKRTSADVDVASAHQQQPWLSTNLVGDFCFRPANDGRCGDIPR
jgi:uncharacterized caspase-like protein